jgi:hypothetical protein
MTSCRRDMAPCWYRFDLGILVVQLVLYQLLLYIILRIKYERRAKK